MITRNQIMDAVKTRLENMDTVKSVSRRYKEFSQIPVTEMPYVMLTKPREMYPSRAISSLPPIRNYKLDITILLSDGIDPNNTPDELLCDILDDMDLVLKPPVGSQTQTLGGLVDHCYIEGEIICVPGDLDGIGMIQVPLIIVVP